MPKRPAWHPVFLTTLAATCNVTVAAREAGVSRRTAYNHRDRLPGFKDRWDDALEEGIDLLEAEARRRAVEGTEKPALYQGRPVGVWVKDDRPVPEGTEGAVFIPVVIREYSDTLLIFLLKANRPEKYRENFDLKKLIAEVLAERGAAARTPLPPTKPALPKPQAAQP